MTSTRLKGVIAAIPTPVTPDGEPDLPRFLRHAHWLLENGCDGLNVLGTTGEANSFSASQRKAVMSAAAGELDRGRLMVGTGAPDLATTIELTRFAHDKGFAAALILPPYYYKGVSDEGLFRWFATVVGKTADAPIPIYLYNFPQMTGLKFSPALAARLRESFPERIAGAKDSSGDLAYAAELARIDGFDVFPSSETALARVDEDGYAGCISATVSATAPLAARLWKARSDAGLLKAASDARAAISSVPLIPAVKHMVARLHDDPEYERLLPPHLPLSAAEKQTLAALDPRSFTTAPA
ncbi:dihydrodipicolinate synthase family protein [Aquibium sp. LZ166]|uniref:Dihydrodipicolinate synthase family protein n=1 Tax=Aquibium pacificus TaxID=3153579 RepID=A0ABV3SFV9_9HYPH